MNCSAKLDEVARLAGWVCDAALSNENVAQLDALLADDPEAQLCYLRQLEVDAALAWRGEESRLSEELADMASWSRSSGAATLPPRRLPRNLRTAASIAAVATLFYGAFVVVAWNLRPAEQQVIAIHDEQPRAIVASRGTPVATISGERDAAWRKLGSGQSLAVGSVVLVGFAAELDRGTAELTLVDGAVVELTGPSLIELRSTGEVYLERGKLTAEVPPQAVGFTVRTPTATIVDLGTEFGVETHADGLTEVHVLRGMVEARTRSGNQQPKRITAQQALRFDSVATSGSPVEIDSARFLRQISGQRGPAAERTAAMLSLDEIVPGTEYATLVANGDFSERGELIDGSYPHPEVWRRDLHMFVGAPEKVLLPSFCATSVAYATIDAKAPDCVYSQSLRLQPNSEYVLSAYLWNFGDDTHQLVANVDLQDAPGEANLRLLPSRKSPAGSFVYQSFHTDETGIAVSVRIFYDTYSASDDRWPKFPVGAMWDRVAITKATRFMPPRLRNSTTINSRESKE